MGYENLTPLLLLGEGTAAQGIQEISYSASTISTPNLLKFEVLRFGRVSLSFRMIQLAHHFVIETQEECSEGSTDETQPEGLNPWHFRHFGFQTS